VDPSDQERSDSGNDAPHHADGLTPANRQPGNDDRWLRSVVKNSSEIVKIVDPDGTLRYANPAFERVLSYDLDEAIGTMNVLDHVHPDDLAHVLEETEKVLGEGSIATNKAEYRFRHKDGSWRWMECVGTYLLGDPHVGGVVVTSRDVTERKEAEDKLREAEERYRTLVEYLPAVTYIDEIDEVSSAVYMSPQVEGMLGYTPEEWLEDPEFWIKILHPDDKEMVLAEARRTNETGDPFGEEYRVISKSGHVVWVRDEAGLVMDGQGTPLFWQGVLYDITERRRVETALRESEQRFRRSFDDAAIGMALVAPDGRFLRANRSLCENVGYSEEELLGKTFQDITHPDDLEKDLDHLRRMLAGEIRTYQIEKRYFHKEGHVVWALLSVSLVHGEEGEPLYFVSQIQNVTERKRAEDKLREAEELYRTLVEQIPAVTYIDWADGSDTPLYTSPQIEEMLGYTSEEWRNEKLWSKRLHPDDRERVLAADERFEKEGEERFGEEYRLLAKDGSVVWVREEAVLVRAGEGNPLYWQGVIYDLTKRKEAEDALKESAERYRTMVELQTELVCRFLPDLTLSFVNDAFCRYLGKGPEELVGGGFLEYLHEVDHAYYEEQLVRLNPESPTSTIEERVFTPGGVRWVQWTDTAIFDVDGRIVEYQSVGWDITERKVLEERLRHQALHDLLTGLPNRHLLLDRLGHALARTGRRGGRRVAVLFMDLDDFKIVNDSLGHEMGDGLLVAVGERLKGCLRPEDTLARFGGDEFVVLLEDVDGPDEPVRIAERITHKLRDPFVLDGRELYARTSIGIAMGEDRTKDPDDLLRDADTAMYRAKDEGSGYSVFDRAMYERALDRLEAENALRRAIEREEFVVHYQPIVSLQSGEVFAVEALVRWEHPERGLLEPSEFVPMAEESELVIPIGEQVLRAACFKAKEWQEEHPRIPHLVMSVNLSARQLSRPDLAETVERILGETGMEGSRLTLDVTETVYVRALETNTVALQRLRSMGVRTFIDDFGTGYSSLSYLKRLPADAIKIDKSFVKSLGQDDKDTAIIRMIIELAHTLGMVVIAEGVEAGEQAALLREMGCDMAQGLYFVEPLPAEAAPEFLADTPT
jgi:diguanylate cyclase (GGDEF)-like protein/PAS domain S-box-containing protein